MDDLGYPHFTNPPYSWNFNDVLARGGSPASDKDLGERCASVARAEMGMQHDAAMCGSRAYLQYLEG